MSTGGDDYDVEDLKLDVRLGQAIVERHRKRLADLVEQGADSALIESARYKLAGAEEVLAEQVADLQRLTTN